jgi:hypothetical protein
MNDRCPLHHKENTWLRLVNNRVHNSGETPWPMEKDDNTTQKEASLSIVGHLVKCNLQE